MVLGLFFFYYFSFLNLIQSYIMSAPVMAIRPCPMIIYVSQKRVICYLLVNWKYKYFNYENLREYSDFVINGYSFVY